MTTVQFKKILPKNLKTMVGDKDVFMFSVMNEDTAKVVFDKTQAIYSPTLSVYALKTYMVTQALIAQLRDH